MTVPVAVVGTIVASYDPQVVCAGGRVLGYLPGYLQEGGGSNRAGLLRLVVPDDLLTSGFALGGKHVDASALFCDIRSFTSIAEAWEPTETIELLNDYDTLMMDAIGGEGGMVNKMIGAGLLAMLDAPVPRGDHRRQRLRAPTALCL